MTRYALSAALLLACSTPLLAQRCRCAERRVLDAAAIAAAGWHRLGEIVAALPPGATASVEGFNHAMTGSRVGFAEASGAAGSWRVMLDGQAMPVAYHGLWLLDLIPVAMTQIDSVVISSGPRIIDGRATFLGTIELFTRRPKRGPSAIVDYQHGDETGDPGPYRYTSRSTDNVEKLGPYTSGAAAFATGRASIDLGARYASLNITDSEFDGRFPNFSTIQGDVNASGASGVARLSAAGGEHFVIGGRGRLTGYMRLAGEGDRAGRVVATHGGAAGTVEAARLRIRYGAVATRLEFGPPGNGFTSFDTEDRTIGDAFVEAGRIASAFRVGGGITAGEQASSLAKSHREAERGWMQYDGRGTIALAAVNHEQGNVYFSGSARRELAVGDSDRAAVTVSYLQSRRDGDDAWMDSTGSPLTRGRTIDVVDARFDIATGSLLTLRPTWYARAFTFGGDVEGRVTGIAVGLDATASPTPMTRLWLRGEVSQLTGTPATGEATTPAGFVEGSASATTAGRFVVALSGRFAPGTQWPAAIVGPQLEVPATRRIDVSVNKSLWHERARAQLVIRNLMNARELNHPLGAQWNLRTHLAVTVALP